MGGIPHAGPAVSANGPRARSRQDGNLLGHPSGLQETAGPEKGEKIMSWDIEVRALKESVVYERNVTYNNSQILKKSLGCDFRGLDGMRGDRVLSLLYIAISDLSQHRSDYEPLEPTNGWGGINDVFDLLCGLRNVCVRYTNGIIDIY